MEGEPQAPGEPITALEIRLVVAEEDQDHVGQELAAQAVRVLRALALRGRQSRDLGVPQVPEVLSRPQGPLAPLEQASH